VKKRYRAVILDLFDTVVNFDYSRLPTAEVRGETVHTTSRAVYEALSSKYEGIDYALFYDISTRTYLEFEEMKRREERELPSVRRFELLIKNLGITNGGDSGEFLERLVLAHMNALMTGVVMPEENRAALDYLRKGYRMGLLSNFDYSPAAMGVIDGFGIGEYLDSVIISADVGWRKPKREIFELAARGVGVPEGEIVFVGDNFDADIVGAKGAGMDAAWLKRDSVKRDADMTLPDYVISTFPELLNFL